MFLGSNQRITGNNKMVVGSNPVVRGNKNTVTGSNAQIHGDDNVVTGSNAQIWGNRNRVTGSNASIMAGNDNVICGYNGSISGGGTGNRIESVDDGSSIQSISVGPGGVQMQVNSGVTVNTFGGGMWQNNSKKKNPKKKGKKRERDETQYVEGPLPSDLTHDKPASGEEDAKSCIICLERTPCCVAYPCMHASYCVECARRLCFGESGTELLERGKVACAECRAPVDSIKRVFL